MVPSTADTTTWDRVRSRVFDDHRRIRALLIQIDGAQRHLLDRQPDALEELRKQVRRLAATFRHHLGYEERSLVPLLSQADAARVLAEHGVQRQLLRAVSTDVCDETRPIEEVADEVVWFVDGLLRDMGREEADLFTHGAPRTRGESLPS